MTVPDRAPAESNPPAWNVWLRAGASLLIAWHVVGVMVAPLSTPPNFDGPQSLLGSKLGEVYRPYITAMYLNHAYKFFAPNPGDSHLVRYDLQFADGERRANVPNQVFPDRFRHWPRLLYHRYFMLTEFINDGRPFDLWNVEDVPQQPTPVEESVAAMPLLEAVAPLEDRRPPYIAVYANAFASYLARRHQAVRVELYYRVHRLSDPQEILAGRKLDEPYTYRDRLLATYPPEATP